MQCNAKYHLLNRVTKNPSYRKKIQEYVKIVTPVKCQHSNFWYSLYDSHMLWPPIAGVSALTLTLNPQLLAVQSKY